MSYVACIMGGIIHILSISTFLLRLSFFFLPTWNSHWGAYEAIDLFN